MATSAKKTVSTAPMPKKPARRGKVPFGVCQGLVVDGKDEALLCEGECGLWFHRGCASVPPSRYKILSNSEEPFLCLSCVNVQLMKEIALLKNELRGIAEVRERCTALSNEVSSLRLALDTLRKESASSSQSTSSSSDSSRSVSATITSQRPAGKQSNRSYAKVPSTLQSSSTHTPSASNNVKAKQVHNTLRRGSAAKIKVDGARRIWNTVPTCSARAVANTLGNYYQ